MSNVIQFRKFTRDDLVKSERLEILRYHGTDSGKRLHAFILDSYDEGMAEDAETVDEFISICVRVFNDMLDDEGGDK